MLALLGPCASLFADHGGKPADKVIKTQGAGVPEGVGSAGTAQIVATFGFDGLEGETIDVTALAHESFLSSHGYTFCKRGLYIP